MTESIRARAREKVITHACARKRERASDRAKQREERVCICVGLSLRAHVCEEHMYALE